MTTATINPTGLRASPQTSGGVGVDRAAAVVRGCIIAESGPFRDGRGEFDDAAIRDIQRLMAQHPLGVKSRFSHPTLLSDGLGEFLGRVRNPRVVEIYRDGARRLACRGDLFLSTTAFFTPRGNLGDYVLSIAEEDVTAVGMSLVLEADQELRLDARGRRLLGDNGEPLPPLWKPRRVYGVDLVDTPAATHSFLAFTTSTSAGGFEEYMTSLLDQAFPPGTSRETVESRCRGWIGKYLEWKHPRDPDDDADGYDPDHRGASADPRILRHRRRLADPALQRLLHPVPPPPFRAGDEPGLLPGIVEGLAAPSDQIAQELDGSRSHYCLGCFDDCLARVRRGELAVRLLWSHNEEFGEFASTDDGTLRLYESADGLRFDARLPDNANGRELARRMINGWLGCSCEYAIDHERLQQGGFRALLSAELSEVSLTMNPAFAGTYAAIRPLCSDGHLRNAIYARG